MVCTVMTNRSIKLIFIWHHNRIKCCCNRSLIKSTKLSVGTNACIKCSFSSNQTHTLCQWKFKIMTRTFIPIHTQSKFLFQSPFWSILVLVFASSHFLLTLNTLNRSCNWLTLFECAWDWNESKNLIPSYWCCNARK